VSDVDVAGKTVTVVNPWGDVYPPITTTYAEFRTNFSSIYVNEVS